MLERIERHHPLFYRTFILWNTWKWHSTFISKRIKIFSRQLGLDLLIYPGSSMSRKIYFNEYETETVAFFSRIINQGDCVYDIGANIGFYSLLFSQMTDLHGQVHAFEPSLRELSTLSQNVLLNQKENIVLNHCAASNQTGYAVLHMLDESKDGVYNSLGEIYHPNAVEKRTHPVRVRTICLDAYAESLAETPSVIKIDVEGGELLVLQGARRLLHLPNAPVIVMEENPLNVKGFGVSIEASRDLLLSCGYSLYQIKPGGHLVKLEQGLGGDYSINIVGLKDFHTRQFSSILE